MGDGDRKKASMGAQVNALFIKNLQFQGRNTVQNLCLVGAPVFFTLVLFILQLVIDGFLNTPQFKCDPTNEVGSNGFCAIEHPNVHLSTLQLSNYNENCETEADIAGKDKVECVQKVKGFDRSVSKLGLNPYDATDASKYFWIDSASGDGSGIMSRIFSPVKQYDAPLGANGNITVALAQLFPQLANLKVLNPSTTWLGTTIEQGPGTWFTDFGFFSTEVHYLHTNCSSASAVDKAIAALPVNTVVQKYFVDNFPPSVVENLNKTLNLIAKQAGIDPSLLTLNDAQCIQVTLTQKSSSAVAEDETYIMHNDPEDRELNGIFDWKSTDISQSKLDVTIYANFTARSNGGGPKGILRLTPLFSMATKGFFQTLCVGGCGNASATSDMFHATLEGLKQFPKPESSLTLDFSSLLGPLFFTWVVALLFPVTIGALLYEKEKRLRVMMKMMGLSNVSYYIITYSYWLAVFCLYIALFMIFGGPILGLSTFTLNDPTVMIVFYFLYGNCQLALAFLCMSVFQTSSAPTVVSYLVVIGSALIGSFLLEAYIESPDPPTQGIFALQLIPMIGLYRGQYEFGSYAFIGAYTGTKGMGWKNLSDEENGIGEVMIVFVVEWCVFMIFALYFEQVLDTGVGIPKHPLFFLPDFLKPQSAKDHDLYELTHQEAENNRVFPEDVQRERNRVDELLEDPTHGDASILLKDVQKMYPPVGGGEPKVAVKSLSIQVKKGECFGLLGPNGAGKTTAIGVMTGFTGATSGECYIEGMSVRTRMDEIYGIMGVCPQHDLLWETLTAREHMQFYGKLKQLEGEELEQAIESGLRSVNLWAVADKQAGRYSGGMKRRLSVAMSLIGSPAVCYLDEPSTGLDPASRRNLWGVVAEAKKNRAIILTTHSMEEAEALCDRLGIFVDGELRCLGNPRELTKRYGGHFILQMTTPQEQEADAKALVNKICEGQATLVYSLGGTQTFEVPNTLERLVANCFEKITAAHNSGAINVIDWGIHNESLEEVFVRVSQGAEQQECKGGS